ncbi:MAG: ArsR family transcriptional regulator [Nanoarchaeota archaeon]|nr:ArsR family transcriptional regulator [Nanoarchaeota archaeon]MBU1103189.1 ArsR family transcriptional regulator [Nanoarchaeota archaeon]
MVLKTKDKMADKSKTREITIIDEGGTFNAILRRFTGSKDYDFEGLGVLRKLLSNEKARLLHTIKKKKPGSIYGLAKLLGRDFKSVSDDIKLLDKFGFVDMISEKTGKRERLKPVLAVDSMHIHIKL